MKSLLALALVLSMFAFENAAEANGGLAIVQTQRVRQPLFRPRATVVRQSFRSPLVVQQQVYAAPFVQAYVQPQALFVPQAFSVQSYVQSQAFVVPQVQAFSAGCSSAFFRH